MVHDMRREPLAAPSLRGSICMFLFPSAPATNLRCFLTFVTDCQLHAAHTMCHVPNCGTRSQEPGARSHGGRQDAAHSCLPSIVDLRSNKQSFQLWTNHLPNSGCCQFPDWPSVASRCGGDALHIQPSSRALPSISSLASTSDSRPDFSLPCTNVAVPSTADLEGQPTPVSDMDQHLHPPLLHAGTRSCPVCFPVPNH